MSCKKDMSASSADSESVIHFDASDPANDPYNSPIALSDAVAMFKKRVNPNERPYIRSMMEQNNALVDKWRKEVLDVMYPSGKMPAGRVVDMWKDFEEGHEVRKMYKKLFAPSEHTGLFRPHSNTITACCTFLEQSTIDDLYDAGMAYTMYAWKVVFDEIRYRVGIEKYEKVYFDENYVEWVKRASSYPVLMRGQQLPFWTQEILSDVSAKVEVMSKIRIQPTKTPL